MWISPRSYVRIDVNPNFTSADIGTTAATTTIVVPPGTSALDAVVVVFGDDRASAVTINTVSAPPGWTAIFTALSQASGSNEVKLSGFVAPATVSSFTFTNSQSGAGHQQGWTCRSLTGVDLRTPVDAATTGVSNTGASSVTTNAVPVLTEGALHCIAAADFLGKVPFSSLGFEEKHNAAANASAALLINKTLPRVLGNTKPATVSNSDGTTASEILVACAFALRPAPILKPSTQRWFIPPPQPAGQVVDNLEWWVPTRVQYEYVDSFN